MFPSKVSLLGGAHFPNGGAMYSRIQVLLGTVIHTPTLCLCVFIELQVNNPMDHVDNKGKIPAPSFRK